MTRRFLMNTLVAFPIAGALRLAMAIPDAAAAPERLNDAARPVQPGGLFLAVCWMADLSCHRC